MPRRPARQLATQTRRLYASRFPEWAVIACAAVSRFWRLDYHSIWFDEAVSLSWAAADPAYTWRVTSQLVEEKHPPVYYVALHFWQQLGGLIGLAHNDIYLRALGSFLGVITVVALMATAHRLSGRATSLLAGLLVALSPVLVWYSQEIRMFQPAVTLIVAGGYFLLRACDEERRRRRVGWWLAMILALEGALYSYLFSAFILPAAGMTLLALAVFGTGKTVRVGRFLEGALALSVVGLLFLPLAMNAWGVNASESAPGQAFGDFVPHLRRELKIFTIWRMPWSDLWLWFLGALTLLGLALPHRKKLLQPAILDDRIWLALWIGMPLLVANLLLSRSDSIFSEDRYLLFLAPFVLWAIARGSVALGQRVPAAGWITGLVVVGLLVASLPRLWTPAAARENWRAAAEYITGYQRQSPGLVSATVAHVDYTRQPLEWYLRQEWDFDQLPVFFPFGGTLTADDVESAVAPPLQGIVEFGADTLWLTQSHLEGVDDSRVVEGWLNQNFPLVTEQFPAGVKLTGYALRSAYATLPPLTANAQQPAVEVAPGLMLLACELTTPAVAAQDQFMHPPSGWVHVRLWWQAVGPMGDDYIATAQVVGPEGVWGDRLFRANEALRRHPTSTWPTDRIVRDEVDINLNPVTPANDYQVQIGAMGSDGAPVGTPVSCGTVRITE